RWNLRHRRRCRTRTSLSFRRIQARVAYLDWCYVQLFWSLFGASRLFFLPAINGAANCAARLVLCDRLGQDQIRSQPERGRQSRAAIDNRDWNRALAASSPPAYVKDELGGGQVLAIDNHEIEIIGIKLLGSGDSIERTLAGHRHLFKNGGNGADRLIIRRQ